MNKIAYCLSKYLDCCSVLCNCGVNKCTAKLFQLLTIPDIFISGNSAYTSSPLDVEKCTAIRDGLPFKKVSRKMWPGIIYGVCCCILAGI